MKRESRTVDRSHQVDSPTPRHLPLIDVLVDTRADLMELAVTSGLKVLTTLLEEDRTAICGPRYQHQSERQASRAGTVPSEVKPNDPLALTGSVVTLLSAAILAGYLPARHASRIDPMIALRHE